MFHFEVQFIKIMPSGASKAGGGGGGKGEGEEKLDRYTSLAHSNFFQKLSS